MRTLAPPIHFRTVNCAPPKVPTFCPLCDEVLVGSYDVDAFELAGCCRECEQQFFDPNRDAWLTEGWRPSRDVVKTVRSARQFIGVRDT